MTGGGFIKVGEIRVSLLWVNVIAVAISIPVAAAFVITHIALYGVPEPTVLEVVLLLATMVIQLGIHELVHAVGYMRFGGLTWNQLKFGVNWKACALFCNCLVPVAVAPFRLTALLPMLVLFPLSLAAWISCKAWWLNALAAVVLLGCVGDVVMYVKTIGCPPEAFILEHPSGVGGDLFIRAAPEKLP